MIHSPPVASVHHPSSIVHMSTKRCDKLASLVRESLFVLIAFIVLMVSVPVFFVWKTITFVATTLHQYCITILFDNL